jgi:hypothetical protein
MKIQREEESSAIYVLVLDEREARILKTILGGMNTGDGSDSDVGYQIFDALDEEGLTDLGEVIDEGRYTEFPDEES